MAANNNTNNPKKKIIYCGRCRNHGVSKQLKGHRNICPFIGCFCRRCSLINKRRVLAELMTHIEEHTSTNQDYNTRLTSNEQHNNKMLPNRLSSTTNKNTPPLPNNNDTKLIPSQKQNRKPLKIISHNQSTYDSIPQINTTGIHKNEDNNSKYTGKENDSKTN